MSPAPSYGLDWFEGAIARPDQVLQDFARAVNQTKFAVSHYSELLVFSGLTALSRWNLRPPKHRCWTRALFCGYYVSSILQCPLQWRSGASRLLRLAHSCNTDLGKAQVQ